MKRFAKRILTFRPTTRQLAVIGFALLLAAPVFAQGGEFAVGKRRQRFADGVHEHHRTWTVARRHRGRRIDVCVW